MYNIDINKLVDWLLPPKKRHIQMRVWLRCLVAPVRFLQTLFDQFRANTSYRLYITGQVVYLQKALNDKFDTDQRRINIYNAERVVNETIYRRAEWPALDNDEKLVIYRRSESSPVPVYTRLEGSARGGFIVDVPFLITSQQYYEMRSLLEFYKLASKKYNIKQN